MLPQQHTYAQQLSWPQHLMQGQGYSDQKFPVQGSTWQQVSSQDSSGFRQPTCVPMHSVYGLQGQEAQRLSGPQQPILKPDLFPGEKLSDHLLQNGTLTKDMLEQLMKEMNVKESEHKGDGVD